MTAPGIDEETPGSFKKKIYERVYSNEKILKFSCTASDIERALNILSKQIGGANYLDYALNEGIEVKTAVTAIMSNLPQGRRFTFKL